MITYTAIDLPQTTKQAISEGKAEPRGFSNNGGLSYCGQIVKVEVLFETPYTFRTKEEAEQAMRELGAKAKEQEQRRMELLVYKTNHHEFWNRLANAMPNLTEEQIGTIIELIEDEWHTYEYGSN